MAPTPEETLALLMDPLIRHPISRHSFAPSHTVAGAVCHGCGQRIVALRDHRCLLCGVAAHRRCLYALSEKCKTDASLKCTSDGSHIAPAEPPSGRLDATSSPAAVLNVAVKQPLDRLWRSATRAAETKPPAAGRGAGAGAGRGLREAAARLSLSGLEAPRRPRRDPDDALPPEPAPAPAPTPLPPSAAPDTAAFARLRAAARRFRERVGRGQRAAAPPPRPPSAAWRRAPSSAAPSPAPRRGARRQGGADRGRGPRPRLAGGDGRRRRRGARHPRRRGGRRPRRARGGGHARRGPSAARRPSRSPRRRPPRARGARRGAVAARARGGERRQLRDVAGLDAQARAFANFALKPTPRPRRCGRRSMICIKVRRGRAARTSKIADARFWARETAIDVEALRFAVADDDGAPIVAATDALVAEATYIHAATAGGFVRRNRDADATLERVLAARGGAGEGAARSVRRGAAALAKIGAGRDAHAKLRALVFCLEALGDSDEGPLVTADVLLPRAVACVAEAKVCTSAPEKSCVDLQRDDVRYWAPRATR